MKTLTERRKADRFEMAIQVRALADRLGATVTNPEPHGTQEIRLEIAHSGGAVLCLDFDGESCQPDVHVACWIVRSDSPERTQAFAAEYPERFTSLPPAPVNPIVIMP